MSSDTLARGRSSTTPLIDPRLRDRRIEVARDRGRRRLKRALVIALLLALVAGAVLLTRSPLLDVDRIEVRGAAEADAAEVRAASGIAPGDALVDLDAGAAAARIEQVAWVADATVVRRWPDAVEVRVTVRAPVAVVGTGTGAVLVDGDGRAIRVAEGSEAADELPTIEAAAPALGERVGADGRAAAAVVAGLPAELRAEVAAASGAASGIELELRDGIVVSWGDDRQPSAKAEALGVLLAQDDRDGFARIDVTVPRASTVTYREATAE